MARGQHQLVGGVSLEMRRGRKTEYLDIPLKDNIKGWRLEWFVGSMLRRRRSYRKKWSSAEAVSIR
jgi:hypothetical protein